MTKAPLRVTHVSCVHQATDTRIFWRECVSLADAGYDLTLIARGNIPAEPADAAGVRHLVAPSYRRRLSRMSAGVVHCARAALKTKPDLVHFHDPELLPAVWFFRLLRVPTVFDAHEVLSKQVRGKPYIPAPLVGLAAAFARVVEGLLARAASGVVAVSEPVEAAYSAAKVSTIVANYPSIAEFAAAGSADRTPPADVTVAYIGGISERRGLWQMLDAMNEVNKQHAVRLVMAGPFSSERLEVDARAHEGWRHVDYHGVVGHEKVGELLERCSAGLVLFDDSPNNIVGTPNKMYEYMASGISLIASDFAKWRSDLAGVDCAQWVNPYDVSAISQAIARVAQDPAEAHHMGTAGKAAVDGEFNWESQSARLLGLYDTLLAAHSRRDSR